MTKRIKVINFYLYYINEAGKHQPDHQMSETTKRNLIKAVDDAMALSKDPFVPIFTSDREKGDIAIKIDVHGNPKGIQALHREERRLNQLESLLNRKNKIVKPFEEIAHLVETIPRTKMADFRTLGLDEFYLGQDSTETFPPSFIELWFSTGQAAETEEEKEASRAFALLLDYVKPEKGKPRPYTDIVQRALSKYANQTPLPAQSVESLMAVLKKEFIDSNTLLNPKSTLANRIAFISRIAATFLPFSSEQRFDGDVVQNARAHGKVVDEKDAYSTAVKWFGPKPKLSDSPDEDDIPKLSTW